MITRKNEHPIEVREHMRGGEGNVLMSTLMPTLPAKMRVFSTITLAPGTSIGYHVHENETELFYFVTGSGRVQDDDAFYDVEAGDAMSTSGGHGHGVLNTGKTDLVMVAAIVKD